MLILDGVLGILLLGFLLFCVLDVLTAPRSTIRVLPRFVWAAIVLLFNPLGGIVWLIFGRPLAAAENRRRATRSGLADPGAPDAVTGPTVDPTADRTGPERAGGPEQQERQGPADPAGPAADHPSRWQPFGPPSRGRPPVDPADPAGGSDLSWPAGEPRSADPAAGRGPLGRRRELAPDDDPEFLAQLRRRIAEQHDDPPSDG